MSSPPDPSGPTVPLHLLPHDPAAEAPIRRRPGRPRKVQIAPSTDQRAYDEQVAEERQAHIERDPLLSALADGRQCGEVLYQAMVGLTQESAALLFEREQGELDGRDVAMIASRRIDALSKLASLYLGVHRLGISDLTASPGAIRKVVDLWLAHVREIVSEMVPSEQADLLMDRYAARLKRDPELGGHPGPQE